MLQELVQHKLESAIAREASLDLYVRAYTVTKLCTDNSSNTEPGSNLDGISESEGELPLNEQELRVYKRLAVFNGSTLF